MSLRLVTPPAAYPLSVEEAKEHLNVIRQDQYVYIEALIAAAFDHIERDTGRAFVAQTWELVIDEFPTHAIHIPMGPIASVVSVTYVDAEGASQTVSPASYEVDIASNDGRVVPANGWPATMETVNAVVVRFTIGADPCPAGVLQAARLLIGLWYDNRATAIVEERKEVPFAAAALIQKHTRYFV